ncbi:MAG: bifunctional [glutamate--ammonia ligase]-adenylyl-L-tyrosine phosphorylase/[glutamate--ammonia-ligase] adenylyltransferase [Burkholderiaceae bacterium]|jgi:glutamate-ammonia-ligase adenylyltransferase|nr:bifunctional [glutamate--ammonia ligase]-adenylyl-L-tyrosine phosphorylase/[glutamate--ammonia-ligase] adenylyltransferase [Burkholderiaceae bacterium]
MAADFTSSSVSAGDPRPPSLVSYSRFVQRVRRRYSDELALLPEGAPVRETMAGTYQALRARGHEVGAALRILRQLVMERLAVLDCERAAPLSDVTRAVTELAEFALEQAYQQAEAELQAQHGVPLTHSAERACLWIIGMGKLGARELNVSSDIDLIYIYDHNGETRGDAQGRGKLSTQEYFARVVKRLYALIGETTEHGFVFRVDLALRPNGNSGPSVISLGALEEYFLVQGREWERFAWMKSRVVAPHACIVDRSVLALRQVVTPFVFRRYLDYGVFESLRDLHRQIRGQAARHSAGRPERANDVKLSRGGIREIEFTVQLLQVVRGGQYPELRTRPTLGALARVASANLMPPATADALAAAYVFLRRVEHRIQYLDDQQTHALPSGDDLDWLAAAMGYSNCSDFLCQLDAYRELVAQEFDILLSGPEQKKRCKNCKSPQGHQGHERRRDGEAPSGSVTPAADWTELLGQLPAPVAERVAPWRESPRFLAMRASAQARLFQLVQRVAQWLHEPDSSAQGQTAHHLEGAVRWVDWIEPLFRRESYIALLVERPVVQDRLLRMLGAARWPARYLLQHPGVIDELAGGTMLDERFNSAEFEDELERRYAALRRIDEADEESLLNLLRRAHHAEIFRTLARDVEGRLSVEQVADDLSALADTVLRVTARWCWPLVRNRHREQPRFAIIGYGKLGGKELGYGSDLDIVFVFDDEDELASEIYPAYARKLINWLTVKTGEGDLFEIDTALRPNGNSGLLTTSFASYEKYQLGRGSNTAWTWEHQAMTRARFVLGDPALGARFDAVREAVITAPRDIAALKTEITAMRERVRAAHSTPGDRFDLKHSPGGMVDAEFAVQMLVLSAAHAHRTLIPNVGNIALLQRAEEAGLLPAGVGRAAGAAYRELRRVQHRARLDEEPTQVPVDALMPEREAMAALWRAVFGASMPQ